MSTPTALLPFQPATLSTAHLAPVSFLARASARTHHLYTFRSREWFDWRERNGLDPLVGVQRAHVELYIRSLGERGLMDSSVVSMMNGVRGFFRFAHIDGLITADPAVYARLPKVQRDESRTQGLDRLELIRFLQVAQPITVHLDRRDANRMVTRIAKSAGIPRQISPHSLRRAAITNALDAGVPLRDAQILARHADPRTTEHYDRARGNLDRHAVHFLTAYIAGVQTVPVPAKRHGLELRRRGTAVVPSMDGDEPAAHGLRERSPTRQGRAGGPLHAGSREDGDRPVRVGTPAATAQRDPPCAHRGCRAARATEQVSRPEIDHLSVEDLLEIAAGVLDQVAIRDVGLLAVAAGRPQATVFGDDAYPTFTDKAAALLHTLVLNHALVDGNKRLGWSATRVFCLLNGHDLTYTIDEVEDLMLSAASGRLDVPEIADWLAVRLRPASLPGQSARPDTATPSASSRALGSRAAAGVRDRPSG